MNNDNYVNQLKPCSKCGEPHDLHWCGISVRPYCGNCNNWGAVNYLAAEDAIASWNASYERAEKRWRNESQIWNLEKYSKQIGIDLTIQDLIDFHRAHSSQLFS
jgi:hypothetical protein